MSAKIVTVSVPHPIPATWARPDLSKSPIAILWLSTLGTRIGAPSVPSAACANSWMPSPDSPIDDVGPPVAVDVADVDGLRPLSVGARGRVRDRRGQRAVRQAREHEQPEVGGGVGVARGQDDVGDAVAGDVTDGDRFGLRTHRP